MHELGQPLHAYDLEKIKQQKLKLKKLGINQSLQRLMRKQTLFQ